MRTTPRVTLTDRRREVLREFLRREDAGEPPPTLRELAARFGNSARHAQRDAIGALAALGLLRVNKTTSSRSVHLTPAGRAEARGPTAQVGAELDALRRELGRRRSLPPAQLDRLVKELRDLRERFGRAPC